MGQWTLELQTFRDFETEVEMLDENESPLNIAGWFFKYEIVHDEGTVTWSTTSGHVTILTPTTNGKAKLAVPKAEFASLPFEWAVFKFFAGPDAANPDEIYVGKASRR